jgi:hypothetical protein
MPIEDFFQRPEPAGNHPLLRFVAARKAAGDQPGFQLFRPHDTLGFRKAKIYIHFFRDGTEVDCKDDDWDDDLNSGLIRLGVRSGTADEEADRFVLGLRAALRKPEKRYGDGYFSSVLIEYVRGTDFHTYPDVAEALRHISTIRPDQSQSYSDCRDMIDAAVRGRAVELSELLGYDVPTAWAILAKAMAGYLDERFSVTSRRLLGLM